MMDTSRRVLCPAGDRIRKNESLTIKDRQAADSHQLVEAAGIEPASEKDPLATSTGLDRY